MLERWWFSDRLHLLVLRWKRKEETSIRGMLGFGSTMLLIECGFCFCFEVYWRVWAWTDYCRCSRVLLHGCAVFFFEIDTLKDIHLGNLYLCFFVRRSTCISIGPDIRQDYPLNLSILISGGKETNKDSPSNGEWSGMSSSLKSLCKFCMANCSL